MLRLRDSPDGLRTKSLRFYYGTPTDATRGAGTPTAWGFVTLQPGVLSPYSLAFCQRSRPAVGSRRYEPDRPPVFSHKAMSPSTIDRSADLHMS